LRQLEGGRDNINGLEAYVGTYQGNMQGVGQVLVRAAHIVHERRVFIFAGLAPTGVYDRVERSIAQSLRSFEPLSREAAARIQPNRIDLYTVRQGDTWQSIARRSGEGNVPATTLAIMNNYDVNQQPRTGDRIKIVVAS
jgi:predicted Zn-dependent protease